MGGKRGIAPGVPFLLLGLGGAFLSSLREGKRTFSSYLSEKKSLESPTIRRKSNLA